jgi:NodT family efflux transporter outer membrane factor (OMF) lipoprotein
MKHFIFLICFIFLSGCSFAPKYQRPPMIIPHAYKETGKWLQAKPTSASLDRGSWWRMYHDPILNQLEDRVGANQNLRAAVARYDEARAILATQRSALYPNVIGVFNAYRQRVSENASNFSPSNKSPFNDVFLSTNLAYEIDVWGRVRNSVAAAKSLADASAADWAAIKLSIQAELASDYFSLRSADAAQRILDQTVVMYEKALFLTNKRFKGGASPAIDVDQAQSQLYTAKRLADDMRLKRALLEHAIAVLIGQTPATFSLKVAHFKDTWVVVAPSFPSTLLERRPDISEAELKVQAANYNIGVARAAFFPAFNISAALGFESAAFNTLLSRPSVVWALGPTAASALLNDGSMPLITQTIFDGGKLIALTRQACAQYFQAVANYRQTVLTAYQEVEDNLAALRQLDRERQQQTIATAAALRAANQSMFRYKGGLTTYLDVVVIQNLALQAQLANVDIHTRRQLASVQLIKALGGGFQATI